MNRRRIVCLVVGLLTAVVSLTASASASASFVWAEDYSHEIFNFHADMCLQPVSNSTEQGAAIVQEPCDGRSAQHWAEVPVSGSIVHYRNGLSGLCLDVRGGAVNGAPVQQWTCNGISNEKWEPQDVPSDDIPALFSRVSGTRDYCLDIPGGQTIPGLTMQIYRCNGTAAQTWWLPTTEGN